MKGDALGIARQRIIGSQPGRNTSIQAVHVEQRFINKALRATDDTRRVRIKVLRIGILLVRQHRKRVWMRRPLIACCAITAGSEQYNQQYKKRKAKSSGTTPDFTRKARMEYHEEPP